MKDLVYHGGPNVPRGEYLNPGRAQRGATSPDSGTDEVAAVFATARKPIAYAYALKEPGSDNLLSVGILNHTPFAVARTLHERQLDGVVFELPAELFTPLTFQSGPLKGQPNGEYVSTQPVPIASARMTPVTDLRQVPEEGVQVFTLAADRYIQNALSLQSLHGYRDVVAQGWLKHRNAELGVAAMDLETGKYVNWTDRVRFGQERGGPGTNLPPK